MVDRKDGESYVMKVMNMSKFTQPDVIHAMEEIRVISCLNHINVIQVRG